MTDQALPTDQLKVKYYSIQPDPKTETVEAWFESAPVPDVKPWLTGPWHVRDNSNNMLAGVVTLVTWHQRPDGKSIHVRVQGSQPMVDELQNDGRFGEWFILHRGMLG